MTGHGDVLYCEAARYPKLDLAAITRSTTLNVQCVRLDDLKSKLGSSVLEYDIALIPISGARVPDAIYDLCRWIRSMPCPLWRMEPAVLLMLCEPLLDTVDADLRSLGCDLMFRPNADQLLFRLQSEMAYRTRAKRQGVLIERITEFDWRLCWPPCK